MRLNRTEQLEKPKYNSLGFSFILCVWSKSKRKKIDEESKINYLVNAKGRNRKEGEAMEMGGVRVSYHIIHLLGVLVAVIDALEEIIIALFFLQNERLT
uniref:Uncharacterized protein n=1 Tax=Cucumis melo TaxID=3656 RepID=A0A9I9EBH7_CUCME